MGKACNTILGLGIAGAIIGLHVYMFMGPKEQCEVKDEFKDVVNDLKKAAGKLAEIG